MVVSDKGKLTIFSLVYPPISNQEAVWLQKDPDSKPCCEQAIFT